MTIEAPYPYLQASVVEELIAGRETEFPEFYCSRTLGSCMEPLYPHRSTVVVRTGPVSPGDAVVVYFRPEAQPLLRLPLVTAKRLGEVTFETSTLDFVFSLTSDNIPGEVVHAKMTTFFAMHRIVDVLDVPWPGGAEGVVAGDA